MAFASATRRSVPVVRRVRPARQAARLPGGVLSGVRHCFDQNRALFVFLGIARNGTAKLPAFAAVKEPLGPANGDDHFAFGARHLHPPNMHQIRSVPSQTRRELGIVVNDGLSAALPKQFGNRGVTSFSRC